jgi:hypothetical protein
MFAKIFDQMFTGSMMGAGAPVFAVWTYVLANCNRKGEVELNPKLMAVLLGMQEQEVADVIEQLCSPDPASRTPDHEGRRLLKQGRYSYFAPNYAKYREIRCEEERREALRLYQRAHREKKKATAVDVNDVSIGQTMSGESSNAEALDASTSPSDSECLSSGERRESERGEATPKKRKPREKREESPLFIEFMDAYAKKLARSAAWAKWQEKIGDDEELARRVIKAAFAFAKKPDSVKNNRQFQPYPATWLNQERWKDEVAEPTAPKLTAEEEAAAERERMAEEFDHDFWRREAEEDAKRSRHQREVEERIWKAVGCPDATQFRWRIAGHPGASEAQRQELKEVGL